MGMWDSISVLALMFTMIFTPYEVAFIGAPQSPLDRLFLTNRVVDGIFCVDIVIQFFLMQCVSDKFGDRWIADHRLLATRYLRGWFAVDVLSTAASAVDVLAVAGAEGVSQLKVFRVVRVLRLIKLLRLARSSRIISRWESKVSINYAALSLVRVLISICLCAHWAACLWNLLSSFSRPSPRGTWLEVNLLCVAVAEDGSSRPPVVAEADRYREVPPQGDSTGWLCASPADVSPHVARLQPGASS